MLDQYEVKEGGVRWVISDKDVAAGELATVLDGMRAYFKSVLLEYGHWTPTDIHLEIERDATMRWSEVYLRFDYVEDFFSDDERRKRIAAILAALKQRRDDILASMPVPVRDIA